ncbi:hypothetical protein CVIRNUC_007065 [Coccomyxa viridis]|uniref:Uncharacterized protein n=1 Tax=Coccomyxa viridis TaxID=1274662 RepID=A0AAV1IBH0_9CHLO|nr:hypothetical protein CVIRNUC_007065 [Coccomyxa viridis]
MTSKNKSWQRMRTRGWADEVDDDWDSPSDLASPVFDETSKQYKTADGAWHEDISVERGQSQQRLDLDSGFMRSIRQNQYARDDHEQAWQDASDRAPSFQQRWGVGIRVPPQRRGASRLRGHPDESYGVSMGEEEREPAESKAWWRQAADIQHAPEVKILRRAEAQKQGTPGLQAAEPQLSPQPELHRYSGDSASNGRPAPVSHDAVEAELLQRNRAINGLQEPSYSNMQAVRAAQPQHAPLIDSHGIAMGIPVEWAMSTHPPASLLRFSHSQASAPEQHASSPEDHSALLAPLSDDPGTAERPLLPQPKQEKVKLGFQLYKPPTLLAQASPEVRKGRQEPEVPRRSQASGGPRAAPVARSEPAHADKAPARHAGSATARTDARRAAAQERRAPASETKPAGLGLERQRQGIQAILLEKQHGGARSGSKDASLAQRDGARSGAQEASSAQLGVARSGAKEASSAQPAASRRASTALQNGQGTARGKGSAAVGSTGAGSQAGSRSRRAGAVKQAEPTPAGQPAKAAPRRQARAGPEVADRAAQAPKELSSGQRTQRAAMEGLGSEASELKGGSSAAQGTQQSRGGSKTTNEQPAGQRAMARAAGEGMDRPKQLLTKAVREAQAYNASTEKPAAKPAKQLSKAAPKAASKSRREVVEAPPGLGT